MCSAGANAKLEDEVDCGMVVCADDQQLLEKLDQAAEKGELFLSDSKTCNITFYFVDFLNVLYPVQPSFILTLLCCRFDSTVNSLRTCKSLSSVSGQTGTLYWILWSAGPPRILPLPQHPTACPITDSW